MSTRVLAIVLVVIAAALAPGCDRGYRFQTMGSVVGQQYEVSREFEEFTIWPWDLGGLIGEWWLDAGFSVQGNAECVTLQNATLHTQRGTYPAQLHQRVCSVPPGGGALGASWDFGEQHTVTEMLGEHPVIALELQVGSRTRTLRFEYKRADR